MLKDLAFVFMLCFFIFEVPCVGVSIGIERIFSILEAKAEVISMCTKMLVEGAVASWSALFSGSSGPGSIL